MVECKCLNTAEKLLQDEGAAETLRQEASDSCCQCDNLHVPIPPDSLYVLSIRFMLMRQGCTLRSSGLTKQKPQIVFSESSQSFCVLANSALKHQLLLLLQQPSHGSHLLQVQPCAEHAASSMLFRDTLQSVLT